MAEFRRAAHARVAALLHSMDGAFLERARCYFGGGTQLAMAYGEYRESRDVDFLCSDRAGYRQVRQTVSERSLGALFARPVRLAREVLADRDGVRTFVEDGAGAIKFEIILEARLDLRGGIDPALGVPVLAAESAVAEKLLANADRGLDESFRSRDLIDLAFLAHACDASVLRAGLDAAQGAYGAVVRRALRAALKKLSENREYFRRCVADLLVEDAKALRRGLTKLRAIAAGTSEPARRRAPRGGGPK